MVLSVTGIQQKIVGYIFPSTMFSLNLAVLGVILAAVFAEEKPTAEILAETNFVRQDGYDFEFRTSDGVSRKEEANLITVGDHQGIGVKGSYAYTAPDGQQYEVTYTADDKGYNPQIRVLPAKTKK